MDYLCIIFINFILIIIWNIVLSINIYNQKINTDTQEQYIKSAILDFEVAEIPEIDITKE